MMDFGIRDHSLLPGSSFHCHSVPQGSIGRRPGMLDIETDYHAPLGLLMGGGCDDPARWAGL